MERHSLEKLQKPLNAMERRPKSRAYDWCTPGSVPSSCSGNGCKNTNLKIPLVSVETMTSRDFQHDIHAHIDHTAHLLRDVNCIQNFRMAINLNRHLFRGKTVLDIGCGAGILSLFAAKAGAARVFAVDPSNVVHYTREIVKTNRYTAVIEVMQGHIEDIHLPVEQIDIIISNWMGYSLLYQSLCEAIIYARDKWLRPSGHIFPDIAKLFISGFVDLDRKNEKIDWWKNVYGFNMKCLREFALREPSFYAMDPEKIITTDFNVKTINLYTAKVEDLGFRSLYTLRMLRGGFIDGIFTYFQVHFSRSHIPYMFSTDPMSPHTHWMQSVFFFDQPVPAQAGEILCGGFEMVPSDSDRPNLNQIDVALELCSKDPIQLQVDMQWQLKPHVASAVNSVSDSCAFGNLSQSAARNTEKPVKNRETFLADTLKKCENNRKTFTRKKKMNKNVERIGLIYLN